MSEPVDTEHNKNNQQVDVKKNSRDTLEASKHSREARAKRLKRIRKLTKKSRKSFAETYSISQGTLQNWETARFGGLTEKGARLIIGALKKEDIHCTFNWLMYGAGLGPQKALSTNVADLTNEKLSPSINKKQKTSSVDTLKIETEAFLSSHLNALIFKIEDDNMLPFFSPGELVGGEAVELNNLSSIINEICIVKAEGYDCMVRRVRQGADSGTYTLIATNTEKNLDKPVIYNAKITQVAQIIWARKEDLPSL